MSSHNVGRNVARQGQSRRRQLVELLPPSLGLPLRAWKNYPRLHGLHAPASAFFRLVPEGSNAVDAGANRGIYAYWLAHRARHVYAFEPLPGPSSYLRRAKIENIEVFDVALSDKSGAGTLWVPSSDGEASLVNHVGSEVATPVPVTLARLDDFDLHDVGFVKIDVEGHELSMLHGSMETIKHWRPILFIEIEQRYHTVPIADIFSHLTQYLSYRCGYYWCRGQLMPLSEFRLHRDQLERPDYTAGAYINNFVFADAPIA